MPALRNRLAAALEAGRATSRPPAPAAPPPLRARRMLMALVQGQDMAALQASLASLRKIAAEKDLGLVLVTDQCDTALFQLPGCVTEYLPDPGKLPEDGAQDARAYVLRRLNILRRKWEPVQILPFGETAQALFQQSVALNPDTGVSHRETP